MRESVCSFPFLRCGLFSFPPPALPPGKVTELGRDESSEICRADSPSQPDIYARRERPRRLLQPWATQGRLRAACDLHRTTKRLSPPRDRSLNKHIEDLTWSACSQNQAGLTYHAGGLTSQCVFPDVSAGAGWAPLFWIVIC